MMQKINHYQGLERQTIPREQVTKISLQNLDQNGEFRACPQSPVKSRMFASASTIQELYHFVDEASSFKVVTFSLKQKALVKDIQMIDVRQIKLGLLSSTNSNLKSILEIMNRFDVNKNDFKDDEYHNLEIQALMQKILFETSQFLIKKYKKQIYQLINFQWKQEIKTRFSNIYLSKSRSFAKTTLDLDLQIILPLKDTIESISKKRYNPIEQQILQFKREYEERIYKKQKQLQKWIKCCQQMEQTIKNQSRALALKQSQIQGLYVQNQIYRINQELYEEKYTKIETVLNEISLEISNIKIQSQKQSYYMNPLWDKNLTEEKYFVEIVQLQSDLLIAKNQITSLTDAIINIIELTQSSFNDLGASPRFVGWINGQIIKILREQKPFESVDLDQILCVKQECCLSTTETESLTFTQMKRSGISTFSEIEDSQKLFPTYCELQECLNMDTILQ